ncbi:MAG: hypothetical protein K0S40_2297 [Actinomycetospora sp.]|nr:hypothetical protein [Actinomycetospora sp.]
MSRPADPRRRPATILALVAGGVGLTVALAVPAAATAGTESWAPEIALAGGDDRGVELVDGAVRPSGPETGELVLAPRRTGGPVSAVSAVPTVVTPTGSSVVVQARGLGADGRWGPWVTVPPSGDATLARPTGELSVRVLLQRGAGDAVPVLRGLWLTTTTTVPPTTTTTVPPTTTTTVPPTTTTTVPPTTTTTVPPTTTTTSATPTSTTTKVPPSTTTTVPPTTTTTVAPPTTTAPPTTSTTSVAPPTTTTMAPTTPTTVPPTTTTAVAPTTTTTVPATATTVPATTTTTVAPSTTTPTTTPKATAVEAIEPTTTTTTTTTPIPPPGLVLNLPPDPPYTPAPVTPAGATESSWWGADLLGWLARAF